MKLKTRVTSLDDVPEQYKERYVAADDGKSFTLEEIEIEDVAGLKANNARLLKEKKATDEELKKLKERFGDLDPDAARDAQKKIEDLETKQLMDQGKFEELFQKRTEVLKRDLENKLAAINKQLEAEKGRAGTLEKELQRTVIANELSMQAPLLHIEPDVIPLLQLAAQKDWTLNEEGKREWRVDGQLKLGKDGQTPATMTDYLTEMIAATPSLVKNSNGTGANGNTGRGSQGLTISRNDMRDVRKYEAVKAQAEKMGIPMTQVTVTE